ncbi:MAG TPA: HIT domain-containing protein, partial [Phenylobacterium sp.]|nr:HIT domain-containing protein [Phenylobacterium sp.]
MAAMFQLDPAFAATSHVIGDLRLCAARLQDDARYPWIVLIPRRAALVELEELSEEDQARLMAEVILAGRAVRALG